MLSAFALHVPLHVQEINENVPNHWLVGGIALGLLLAMIAGLLMFGAGREHS